MRENRAMARLAVVGGGPAGYEAALVAVEGLASPAAFRLSGPALSRLTATI